MAFRFALESVLRLRESREQQEQSRLESLAQQVQAAQERFNSCRRQRLQLEQAHRTLMESGMGSSELHVYLVSRTGLETEEAAAAHALTEGRRRWNEQRVRFLDARREREIISSVRQRQLETYRIEQARREQQEIDDLFASRRLR